MISEPPISASLPVARNLASWPRTWASFFSQVWQSIQFGWYSPVKTVTQAYTVQNTDSVILINGDITVTLMPTREAGPKRLTLKVINAGGGTRTVDGDGANIDGVGTWTSTTQYDSIDVVTDGSNWFIV